jgi:hypothetical protein
LEITDPDVDGHDGRWIVAWQQNVFGTTNYNLACRGISQSATGGLALGPTNTPLPTVGPPAVNVGFTPGRTWLSYRDSLQVHVRAVDSGSCIDCADHTNFGSGGNMIVATAASGGATDVEVSLVVWNNNSSLVAQRLQNHGLAGGTTNLGGGCGAGGTQTLSHQPGIGSSGLVCTVNSLPPGALVTFFNFAAPGSTLPCGTCVWTPFSVTQTPPIVSGAASVEFPIPCLTSLIGAQFETQWTTIALSQTPCPLLPGFALSDRMLMTIGN